MPVHASEIRASGTATQRLDGEIRDALAPATGRLDPQQRRQLARLLEPVVTPPLPVTRRTPAQR
ncbi:hypothetical protein [Streptomyces sp. NRRL S-340]|uniref:hypothetical protein n=1 Tax=Streptomyces sp. NRRL S-340 TaxID=1463901 RepID=UPI0005671A80|nr:hypothetical protein [Streptomyces sp. NRRL S-340]